MHLFTVGRPLQDAGGCRCRCSTTAVAICGCRTFAGCRSWWWQRWLLFIFVSIFQVFVSIVDVRGDTSTSKVIPAAVCSFCMDRVRWVLEVCCLLVLVQPEIAEFIHCHTSCSLCILHHLEHHCMRCHPMYLPTSAAPNLLSWVTHRWATVFPDIAVFLTYVTPLQSYRLTTMNGPPPPSMWRQRSTHHSQLTSATSSRGRPQRLPSLLPLPLTCSGAHIDSIICIVVVSTWQYKSIYYIHCMHLRDDGGHLHLLS